MAEKSIVFSSKKKKVNKQVLILQIWIHQKRNNLRCLCLENEGLQIKLLLDTRVNCNNFNIIVILFFSPVAYQSNNLLENKKQEMQIQRYKSIGIGYGRRSDFTI